MSTEKLIPPLIGEYWHGQGGIFVGTINNRGNEQWHLILAVAQNKLAWGKRGVSVEGADDFWDGAANTAALLTAESPIAIWAASLEVDGHKDFYIPAQRELNLLNINANHLAEKVIHWSSTQYGAYYAWSQDFEYGYQHILIKGDEFSVRAVRRITLPI